MSSRRLYEDERKLIYRCAQLYHILGKKQEEIGELLDINRQKVAYYLNRAAKEGIIKVITPRIYELERELIEEFRLWDVRIVFSAEDTFENRRNLGLEAACYFEEKIKDGSKIGLSGGLTIYEMVNSLTPGRYEKLVVYPLSVGGSARVYNASSNTLVELMYMKNPKITGYTIQLSSFITVSLEETEKEKERLFLKTDIKEVFDGANNDVEFGFCGIGYFGSEESTLVKAIQNFTTEPRLLIQQLEKQGIVGDINYQVYSISGQIIDCEINRRAVAVPLTRLKKMVQGPTTHVAGVAGWHDKARAILGAIRGNFIDVLITDENTANEILRLNREGI